MPVNWVPLLNQPKFNADTMLLLTDGTVMCHELDSNNWHRLTPDTGGYYEKGTWSPMKPLPDNPIIPASKGGPKNAPLYFASAVLADGRVFTAGGEYNAGNADADTLAVQVYDPLTDDWTIINPPAGWTAIGDAPSCVLANGKLLLGYISGTNTAIFDPATNSFSPGPNKGDSSSEESFALLRDGSVLAVQCTNVGHAEKLVGNTWVSAGATPVTLPQSCPGLVAEIGATILLPSGQAFAIGATGNTALYHPPATPAQPGTWTKGPTLHDDAGAVMYPMDAPAVLMPNGKVLLVGSPAPPCNYPGPSTFFEYDPATNKAVPLVVPAPIPSRAAYFGRFLLLPSGNVLFSNNTAKMAVYEPVGAPNPSWTPTITSCPTTAAAGATFVIKGRQFNGLSQAVGYGDDAQAATNYPLVRVVQKSTVAYWRTAHHSTMAVGTGAAVVSTNVTIPAGFTKGDYKLSVVANGIPSDPVAIKVT